MDFGHKLDLRQMGRQDCDCEIRSVFAIVGFPAETGKRLVSAGAVCGHVVVCPGRVGLRSPALGVGVLPLWAGRLGGCVRGVRGCVALPLPSWRGHKYTMVCDIKLVH